MWNKSTRLNWKGNVLSKTIESLIERLTKVLADAKKNITEADAEIKELEKTKKTNNKVIKFVNNIMKGVE